MAIAAPPNPRVTRRALRATTIVLFVLSTGYLGWGFWQLVVGNDDVAAIDLEARWLENRYVLQQQNPFDVFRTSMGTPRDTDRDASIDPDIGPLQLIGYPPWSYVPGAVLVPPIPTFVPVRAWFAALSALALAFLAQWTHRGLRDRSPTLALLGVATVLGLTSNLFTLSAGQYGLIVNALLAGSFALAAKGRSTRAGFALGVALLKPQSAGTFVLVHLARGSLCAVAVAAALTVICAAVVLLWIDTGPLEYLRDMAGLNIAFAYGLPDGALEVGGSRALGTLVQGIGGTIVAALLLWRYRAATLWTQLAIAAVVGRLWSYHGVYDNVMLVFLPLALLEAWSEGRGGRAVPLAWVAVMATLAAPIPYEPHRDWVLLQIAHVAIWITGLVILLRGDTACARRTRRGTDAAPGSAPADR